MGRHIFEPRRTKMIESLVIAALFLTACGTTVGHRLIARDSCAAPCWYGIVPGKTSTQDAGELLEAVPYVRRSSIETKVSQWKNAPDRKLEVISWKYSALGDSDALGIIRADNGTVLGIYHRFARGIYLGDLIEIYGEPGEVSVARNPDGSVVYGFVYPHKGIQCVGIGRPARSDSRFAELSVNIRITDISFFPSMMSLKEYYTTLLGFSEDIATRSAQTGNPWPGLGTRIEIPE